MQRYEKNFVLNINKQRISHECFCQELENLGFYSGNGFAFAVPFPFHLEKYYFLSAWFWQKYYFLSV